MVEDERGKKMKENRKVGNETNLKKLLFFCYSANLQWREPWAIEQRMKVEAAQKKTK